MSHNLYPLKSLHDLAAISNYPGSKRSSQLLPHIINLIPPHLTYLEAFAGSAGVAVNLRQSFVSILNDIDPLVCRKLQFASAHGYRISNLPADVAISTYMAGSVDEFIYLDPPYPVSSRKSSRPLYRYEMSDQHHVSLLQFISSWPGNILLSTYPNDIYSKYLTQWNYQDVKVSTHSGMATERLYYNYPRPAVLHDYSYIGHGRTHRQQLKRQHSRWIDKLSKMAPLQRNAMLNSINSSFS